MRPEKKSFALVVSFLMIFQLLLPSGLAFAEPEAPEAAQVPAAPAAPNGGDTPAAPDSNDSGSASAASDPNDPGSATIAPSPTDLTNALQEAEEAEEAEAENSEQTPDVPNEPQAIEYLGVSLLVLQTNSFNPTDSNLTISTAADLLAFAAAVNGGNSFAGQTVSLAGDLGGGQPLQITPIGIYSDNPTNARPFLGTFDGAGHTIANLQPQVSASKSFVGLFGYAGANSTIKDLKLLGGSIAINEDDPNGVQIHHIGSLAARADGAIIDCTSSQNISLTSARKVIQPSYDSNNNSISPSSDIGSIRTIGGLVGELGKTGSLSATLAGNPAKRCVYSGTLGISCPVNTLEDLAYVAGEIGGLVGLAGDPTDLDVYPNISDAENQGTLSFNVNGSGGLDRFGQRLYAATACVGGIVGATTGSVFRCVNNGNLQTSPLSGGNPTAGYGAANLGGIVGMFRGNDFSFMNTGHKGDNHMNTSDPGWNRWVAGGGSDSNDRPPTVGIYDCVNNATIVGRSDVGGIVGATGSFTVIEGCANYGNITGCRWNKPYTAGIAGNSRADIRYCFNQGQISSLTGAGYYCAGIAGGQNTCMTPITLDNLRYPMIEMTGCYSTGSVYSTAVGMRTGSLIGETTTYNHHNAYLPNLTLDGMAIYDDSGIFAHNIQYSTADLKAAVGIALLNDSAAKSGWTGVRYLPAPPNTNNGYPVLSRTAMDWVGASADLNSLGASLTLDAPNAVSATYSASSVALPQVTRYESQKPYLASAAVQSLRLGTTVLYQNADFYIQSPSLVAGAATGTAGTATIVGMGRYKGTWSTPINYTIKKAGIDTCTIVCQPLQFNWEIQDPANPVNAGRIQLLDAQGNVVAPSEYEIVSLLGTNSYMDGSTWHFYDYLAAHRDRYKYDVRIKAMASSTNYEGVTTQPAWRIEYADLGYHTDPTNPNLAPTAKYGNILWGSNNWDLDTALADKTGATIKIAYTGKLVQPTFASITYLDRPLRNATGQPYWENETAYDYLYVYGNPNPGESTVTSTAGAALNVSPDNQPDCMTVRFSPGGSFNNYINIFYQIVPANVEQLVPTATQPNVVNVSAIGTQKTTGNALKPKPTVTYNGMTLKEGSDYKLSWANNYLPGQASVTVTGIANFSGSRVVNFTVQPGTPVRLAGTTRHHTAALASLHAFPEPAANQAVIVACASNYPDALAASSLAGMVNAPILLSATAALDADTKTELLRLKPKQVYIVGGTASISNRVFSELQALPSRPAVERLGGADRFQTGKLIADKAASLGAVANEIYLTSGDNFPDALAVSSFSVIKHIPVLITPQTSLSRGVTDYIKSHQVKKVTIIGGVSAVSANIERQLKTQLGSANVKRLQGADRYETARVVITDLVKAYRLQPNLVGVATGDHFADALSGGASLGARGGILILTPASKLHNATKTTLTAVKPYRPAVEILGGESAVSATTYGAIRLHMGY